MAKAKQHFCIEVLHVQCILFCEFYSVQKLCILPKIDTQKYKILYAGTKF